MHIGRVEEKTAFKDWVDHTEQSRAGQSGAEQSKGWVDHTEQSRADKVEAEQDRAEQGLG